MSTKSTWNIFKDIVGLILCINTREVPRRDSTVSSNEPYHLSVLTVLTIREDPLSRRFMFPVGNFVTVFNISGF